MDEMNQEFLKEFLFTVSNPTHELVSPEQYGNLVSTESQYQLIPGIGSEMVDDPWEVLLALLPQSKTTLIDVALPFIFKPSISLKQIKISARYLIYKQQILGIKISTSNIGSLQQALKTQIAQFSFSKRLEIEVPEKIINFYQTNKIEGYEKTIKVGNFFLSTCNFRIALLFLSQIKDQNTLLPYIKVGCEVISIVNDEQFNYDFFVTNFQNPLIKETILASRFYKLNRIRQVCEKYKIFLVFGGCRVCPSINELYFSKSFLINYAAGSPPIETDDFEFIPILRRSEIKESVLELQHNPNLTNCCEVLELNETIQSRKQIMMQDNLFKIKYPSLQNQVESLDSIVMQTRNFQITPLSLKMREKIQQFIELSSTKINQRESLFSEVNISGKSMIRCMWVFNMMNLFILSKEREKRSPFTFGVPFTKKTKNLFDTIVFIFDRIKCFEERFVGLKHPYQLNDFIQLYRYDERHDHSIEQQLIRKVSGKQMLTIPSIQQLIEQYNEQRGIYLCSDDEEQKNKFNFACKFRKVELCCLDFILLDDFDLPFDIKTQHLDYEGLLSLQKHRNVLNLFSVKLRNIPDKKVNLQNGSIPKQYPEGFMKLKREVLRRRFFSIRDALKFIILERGFIYDQKNKDFFNGLIDNLSSKYKSTINSLSQISKFFTLNSKQQIKNKVSTICQEIIRERQKDTAVFNRIQSQIEIISISSEDQCYETNFTNEENKMGFLNESKKSATVERQKTQEQIYHKRVQQCKKLKMMKQKRITQECHRCRTSVRRKCMQKCSCCFQLICFSCIEQIRGVSGPQMGRQLSRYCPVCHKTCQCERCKKKNARLSTSSLSSQLTKYLFEDHPQQRLSYKGDNTLDNINLSPEFAQEGEKKTEIKHCRKCELQSRGEKRSIWVECESCGHQECYFCVESVYRETKYKLATLGVFYKNWKCFNCDTKWQRYQHNIIQTSSCQNNINFTGTQNLNLNQLDSPMDQSNLSQIADQQMGQANHSINQHPMVEQNQIIESGSNLSFRNQNMASESQVMEKQKENNDAAKDNNTANDNTIWKNNNTPKHQIVQSAADIKMLNQYTSSINQPTIHLPPIDPLRNTPIYPLPPKPQPNQSNQQNKIPTFPQPLPPKPSTLNYCPQEGELNINQKFKQKDDRQDNIQIRQRNNLRRDSSQSNNDNKISEQAKVDIRKKRNKLKEGKPFWGKSKKSRLYQSSSSSSSISSNENSSDQISGSSTPNFAQMSRKSKKEKQKNKNQKNKERRSKNIRKRHSSSSSLTSSSNSSASPSFRSNSSASSSFSSTDSSGQSKQTTSAKKKQEFTITLQQRVVPKRQRNRERSRSREYDTNTKKYKPNKRSNSKEKYPNKSSNSKDSQDEESTRRTAKKYYPNPYSANPNLKNNLSVPHGFIIPEQNIEGKKRSQSSSKRQSNSSKRQSVSSKRESISSKRQQLTKKIKPRVTSFDVEFPNQMMKSEEQRKEKKQQKIEKKQQKKEKEERTIDSRDPRIKFVQINRLDAKAKSIHNQFTSTLASQTNANDVSSNFHPGPSNLCPSPSQSSASPSQSSASPSSIAPTPPSQPIHKALSTNNVNPCGKEGSSQSRQFIRSGYNPLYKPPIRTLVSQSNTNNSFYANYQKQAQQQQTNSQTNRNLLFKKDSKNDEDDSNIQY